MRTQVRGGTPGALARDGAWRRVLGRRLHSWGAPVSPGCRALRTVFGSISWSLFYVGAGKTGSHSCSSGTVPPCPVSLLDFKSLELHGRNLLKAQQPLHRTQRAVCHQL